MKSITISQALSLMSIQALDNPVNFCFQVHYLCGNVPPDQLHLIRV